MVAFVFSNYFLLLWKTSFVRNNEGSQETAFHHGGAILKDNIYILENLFMSLYSDSTFVEHRNGLEYHFGLQLTFFRYLKTSLDFV